MGGLGMKIKDGFMLRQIVGTWIVVPIGERVVNFNGMITLSETGAFLWKQLEEGKNSEEMLTSLLNDYEVDEKTARGDIEKFLEGLKSGGLAE
jgi:hypothetical protein